MNSQQERFFGSNVYGRDSRGTRMTSMARLGMNKHRDVEELEMLLEAYFVEIDGTLNKLSTVCIMHACMSHSTICVKCFKIQVVY